MNKRLEEAIDLAIQEILNENPATVADKDGKTIIDCGRGPAVAWKTKKDDTTGKLHFDYNDKRNSTGPAWHGEIQMYSPGIEVLRGRLWSDAKIASLYQAEKYVEPYAADIEKFFAGLGEDVNTYQWDFDDSSETEGLKSWPWGRGYKPTGPAVKINPEIQKKINDLLPQFHLAAPGPEKDKLKKALDDLYKEAGIENEKELQAIAYQKAAGDKKTPFEKGGGAGMASYRGRLPALQENPAAVLDKDGNRIIDCDEGPAVAWKVRKDDSTGEVKFDYNDQRHSGHSAWHSGIQMRSSGTEVLRGRLWSDERIASFYQAEKIVEPYAANVEKFFADLGEDIHSYQWDFDDSSESVGLKPWPFKGTPSTPAVVIPPEIQKQINHLLPKFHLAPPGPAKEKLKRELDALYRRAGIDLSPEERKQRDEVDKEIEDIVHKLQGTKGSIRQTLEKEMDKLFKVRALIGVKRTRPDPELKQAVGGGGFVAGYKGRLPAIAEDKVRLYNKTLCPLLWTQDRKLVPEVRKALLEIALDFYTDTELECKVQDVQLLGSAANYNWTPKSDLDVHILVDGSQVSMQPEEVEKFFRAMVGKWNLEHDVVVKGHPVELYLQDVHEKNAATGVYSLTKDQWVKDPTPEKVSVDRQAVQKKYTMWVEKINDAIKNSDEKKLKKILEGLRDYRQAGLDENGEFSTENIVFKILRARGFLDKLKESMNGIYDKKHSVSDGYEPTSQGPNPAAGQTDDSNGEFYQNTNEKMRQLEVTQKSIKARHPQFPVNNLDPKMEKLTLDNLKALRDKAKRFVDAAQAANDQEETGRAVEAYLIFNDEIKKRLSRVNNPVDVPVEPNPKFKKPADYMFEDRDDQIWLGWVDPSNHRVIASSGEDASMHDHVFDTHPETQQLDWEDAPKWRYRKDLNTVYWWGQLPDEDIRESLDIWLQRNLRVSNPKHVRLRAVSWNDEDKANVHYSHGTMEEGYGGVPEKDRLKINNPDGSVQRWRIRSKDAPKTPKMTKEVMDMVNEVLDNTFLGTK